MTTSQKRVENFIWISLMVLSVLAAIFKVYVGFDIDEGYAVSMPYRLLQGDRMFLDMWEVHQTSSFLPVLFLTVFDKITGVTTGSVLYLRIVATLIHAVVSVMVYYRVKRGCTHAWAVLLALLYFNLLPKWLVSLDFSLQQVWGLTLVMLLLAKEVETGKSRYAFRMGIVLAATVLAYPGMVLSYPALVASLCILHKDEEIKSKFNKCIFMTAGCALMALLFFGYVLSAMGLKEFVQSIPMVFMDGTHQFTMQTKLMAYASQWMNVAKQLLLLSAPVAIITTVFYAAQKKKRRENVVKKSALIFLLSFTAETSLLVIFANVVGITMGPFHFQVRYLLMFFILFVWSVPAFRKDREGKCCFLFWGPMFQMLVAFVAILIFSNVGPDASSSYLGVGLVAGGFLLYKTTESMGRGWGQAVYLVCALFVLSLIFCKGYYVRITEYGPSNILQQRRQVQVGPLKGIYVLEDDYERVTEDYEMIQDATEGEENLLYLGTEGISNLYAKCSFVSPSTISTPAFNEQWVTYFEMYPDKEPGVIALAKNTIDNREKFFAENPIGIWIMQRYDVEGMKESDSLCIIKRK